MEKKYVDIGKERLAYLDEGQGETLLLLHGNMSSSIHFKPLIEGLKGSFRCIAPDLRGFGDSTYQERFDSFDELAQDVALFMQALDIKEAFLAGWSAGGGVALKLAALYPDRIKKLFLIEGAGHKGYPIFEKDEAFASTNRPYAAKEAMAQDPVQVAPMLKIFADKDMAAMGYVWKQTIYPVNSPSEEDNLLYLSETLKQRNLADLDWALATLNMSAEEGPYGMGDGSISNIHIPVGLTMADKDIVVPPVMVMQNAEALGEHAVVFRYENCGHSPLVDCPDQLIRDMQTFFA